MTKLVMDCKATGGPADLTDSKCRIHAMDALGREVNVSAVVLAHYREHQYAGAALRLLQEGVRIRSEFRQQATRDPFATYFADRKDMEEDAKKRQQTACSTCKFHPSTVFAPLVPLLEEGPALLLPRFAECAESLSGASMPAACAPCLDESRDEVDYDADLLAGMRSHVLYDAFRIVETREGA
jgi:hypothetical protein